MEKRIISRWTETSISNLIKSLGDFSKIPFYSMGKDRKYKNVITTFDIETTSFYFNGKEARSNLEGLDKKQAGEYVKCATMCAWTFGIEGTSVIGRTWEEFINLIKELVKAFGLDSERRMIVWVHNLNYEFQWIRKFFKWLNVFSMTERQPIYALTEEGIEFRCSYLLSGYSLDSLGKQLTQHEIRKMSGDWDYSKFRHTQTKITKKERGYLLNDGRVVMAYICEYLNRVGGKITNIPLTKTGAVRRVCRDNCFYTDGNHHKGGTKYRKYKQLMETLTIQDPEELLQAVRAFQGGFTHANPFRVGDVVQDVTSMDFTSSYPFVMLSEQFPMSKARSVKPENAEELKKYLRKYLCIFDLDIEELEPRILSENPISLSKCWNVEGEKVANGRVVSAKRLSVTLTNIDFSYLKFFYSWKRLKFRNMRIFYKGYLPRDLLLSVLEFYGKKTTLKGVAGMEEEYQQGKEYLNSIYGMSVTAVTRDEIIYKNGIWESKSPDIKEALEKYNKSSNRFLYYYWGIFITAYARRNLFTGIYECCGKGDPGLNDDYCYSDTDSVKIRNFANHAEYFEKYNARAYKKIEAMCKERKIDISLTRPKTKDGVEKPIGVWDFDGHYKRFKTLGAKRYFVEYDDGTHNLTCSGVNKFKAVPWLEDEAKRRGTDIFNLFDDEMIIPKGKAGRIIHTYLDEPLGGYLKDYRGKVSLFREKSAIHLEESEYSLSMTDIFLDYVSGIKTLNKS